MSKYKYPVNEDFFATYTPESVYWAGFIKADGNVYQPLKRNKQKLIKIKLSEKDKNHLEKLRNILSPTRPLFYNKSVFRKPDKYSQTGCWDKPTYALQINSNKLCQDLETNFGIISNKTYLDKPYNIPEEFIKEWIVGVIDGDGSIGYYRQSKNSFAFRLQITTNLYHNALYYRYQLEKIGNCFSENKIISKCGNCFVVQFRCKKAEKILTELNKTLCSKLERKWNIFNDRRN